MNPPAGEWCLGHGVVGQAESLRTGHYVEAHLVPDLFATRDGDTRASKGLARTLEPRCTICRSIRRHHDHHANAERRAASWRREHAARWVKKGRHPDVAAALREMDTGGVTVEALAALMLAALGEPCPGLCAYENDAGGLAVHTIERIADLHVDVRDPTAPFSAENIGILCNSCNLAKGATPWPLFTYHRRAALRAWQDALSRREYRQPEQPELTL